MINNQLLINYAAAANKIEAARRQLLISEININDEIHSWLDGYHSNDSQRTYNLAISRLRGYCISISTDIAALNPIQADNYINYINNHLSAPAARINIAAISSFYGYLERRYEAIENPFRGTRLRPAMEKVKELKVPTGKEVETIINKLDIYESSAASIMAYRGLRAGALPTLEKKGGRYYGSSKGKALEENGIKGIELPEQCIELMKAAKLDEIYPYKGIKSNTLEHRIRGGIKKLCEAGEVAHIYSCHDLRHYYAVEEYEKTKDIYRVSRLLNHSSVTITEGYLRSLDVRI